MSIKTMNLFMIVVLESMIKALKFEWNYIHQYFANMNVEALILFTQIFARICYIVLLLECAKHLKWKFMI